MKKRLIVALAVPTVIFVCALLINGLGASWYGPLIRIKLMKIVDISTAHQYALDPGLVSINFLKGEITLSHSVLHVNTKTWETLEAQGKQPPNKYSISVPEIRISVKDFHKALFDGEVHIRLLRIVKPTLEITNDSSQHLKMVSDELHTGSTMSSLNPFIQKVIIEELQLEGGMLQYTRTSAKHPVFSFHSSGICLQALSVSLFSEDFQSLSILSLMESIDYHLSCKTLDFRRNGGRYLWRAFDLNVNSKANNLSIGGGSIQDAEPQMGAGKRGRSDDVISLTSGSISVFHDNLFRIFSGGKIHFPHISVNGIHFTYLSADTSIKTKIYRMPQEFLLAANPHFSIDTLEFKDCVINYEEIPTNGGPPGSIRFLETEGLITHISNDSAVIMRNPDMGILARSRLYGTGDIQAYMHFDLRSSAFSYTVSMGAFPLKQINSITIPLAALSISRGYIVRLAYTAEGNSNRLEGKLSVKYRNLNVKMVQNDTGSLARRRLRAINTIANAFFVLDDNPLLNGPLRVEQISYSRNVHKSFFYYFWKSLLSGIKPSIGLNASREVEIDHFKHSVAKFNSWKHQTRPERLLKRQQRKQKRRDNRSEAEYLPASAQQ